MEAINLKRNILIIATKPVTFESGLLESLSQKEFVIIEARTGPEVMCQLKEYRETAIIIVELGLEEMNGIEIIREIRQSDSSVPVILVLHHLTIDSLDTASRIGCNEILQIPVDHETIEAIILKYIHK